MSKLYCITWGETGIQSFVIAENEKEAIREFMRHAKEDFGDRCDLYIKSIKVVN